MVLTWMELPEGDSSQAESSSAEPGALGSAEERSRRRDESEEEELAEPDRTATRPSIPERVISVRRGAESRVHAFFTKTRSRRAVRSIYLSMDEENAVEAAGSMAYSLFLASIPMMALAGWAFAAVLHDDPRGLHTVSNLLHLAPWQVAQIMDRHLDQFSGAAVAPVTLFGSLWLGSGAFHTMMNVFEQIFQTKRRSWLEKRLISIACVIALFLAFALSGTVALLIAGGPVALLAKAALGESDLVEAMTWIVAVVMMLLLVAGFFRVAVTRPGIRRRIWVGAATTVTIGAGTSYLFAFWVARLARYAVFYGSIAAVAVFLVWLWLCCLALLLGAEINAQLESAERRR